ncbi:hypothetical protein IQ13_2198 [Lacibacter cauensis]|uniref:Uncharacterized protein n=1 Tax=Lacibacter cauensis TaxID=510947 RepID=A0A562SIW4_9BACT|nr:hypothetical protein [Lacibacter cauensis]TWI81182.1 hypothetical protein IQ13_2198 [Lacibacter cauensis]
MIDYMKLWVEDRAQIETTTALPFLQWRQEHDPKTGEVLHVDKMVCEWGVFQLTQFSKTRLQIAGSLHKYWQGTNHKQFTFSDVQDAIRHMCSLLRLNPMLALIKNLEVGFNIHPALAASEIIDQCICYRNTRPAWPYEKENEAFYFIEFASGDKFIKLYDKGRQYSTTNTLRFETKYMRSRELIVQGAKSLFDLTCDKVLFTLGRKTVQDATDLVFTDHTISIESMTEKEKRLFEIMQNPNVWVYRNCKTSTDYRKEREFERIVNQYGTNKHKEQIVNLAGQALQQLACS